MRSNTSTSVSSHPRVSSIIKDFVSAWTCKLQAKFFIFYNFFLAELPFSSCWVGTCFDVHSDTISTNIFTRSCPLTLGLIFQFFTRTFHLWDTDKIHIFLNSNILVHVIIWTDECGSFRYLEVVLTDKQEMLRSFSSYPT